MSTDHRLMSNDHKNPGPMFNDRYISVIGLGCNRSFDYEPVLLQVVIGLGPRTGISLVRNWLITTDIYRYWKYIGRWTWLWLWRLWLAYTELQGDFTCYNLYLLTCCALLHKINRLMPTCTKTCMESGSL